MFSLPAQAQLSQPDRYEIPITRDEASYTIVPAGRQGLFLMRRYAGKPDDQIELIKLDTAFNEKWRGFLPVDPKYLLMGQKTTAQDLFLLLRYRDFSRNNFELVALDQETGKFVRHAIKNFIPFAPVEFQVNQTAALIGGYYNQVPVVIYYSLATHRAKVLPGLLNESGELTQIKLFDDGTFNVLISARNFQGQKTIWIKNYDPEGNLQSNYALQPEGTKHLIFGRAMKTADDVQLIGGVYGARNSEFSRGLFLASVDPAGVEQLRYYSYGDLENFFKYMKAKRETRIKERIQRRRIRGKKIKFNYRFLVHEIVPYKNQYVLLGEAFYPRYTSMDRSYGGFFGYSYAAQRNMIVRDGRLFDGYYYTHAVVMGFDRDGRLLWDNSFEINDVRTFTLEQFVKLEVQDDKIVLLYLFDNQLRTKIIKDNDVLEGKTIEPIKAGSGTEIAKKEQTEVNKLDYWYEGRFYAYGIQEVTRSNGRKSRVFFINKIDNPGGAAATQQPGR